MLLAQVLCTHLEHAQRPFPDRVPEPAALPVNLLLLLRPIICYSWLPLLLLLLLWGISMLVVLVMQALITAWPPAVVFLHLTAIGDLH
jgi:hypothetical protein